MIKLLEMLPFVSSNCKHLKSYVPVQFYVAFLSILPMNLILPSVFARTQYCSAMNNSECRAGTDGAC